MAPLFLTFEGLDGSGKSTHLKAVAAWMERRGIRCLTTKEPGGTEVGDGIRQLFLDRRWKSMDGLVETLLVFASRRQHLLEVIEPALESGVHVLCDRFTDSTHAYQGAGRGVPRDLIERIDRVATGGRKPDKTLLFDLPAREARERGQSAGRRNRPGGVDRLDAEDLSFYERVREGYLEQARRDPERILLVDSRGSRQATERQALAHLESLLEGSA